jgi:hypothetical protein
MTTRLDGLSARTLSRMLRDTELAAGRNSVSAQLIRRALVEERRRVRRGRKRKRR